MPMSADPGNCAQPTTYGRSEKTENRFCCWTGSRLGPHDTGRKIRQNEWQSKGRIYFKIGDYTERGEREREKTRRVTRKKAS